MTTARFKFQIIVFAQTLTLATACLAYADGNTITRPATADEKSFIVSTKQALKSGLPPLPAGWALDHETALIAEETITFPGKESPIEVKFTADWKRVEGMPERAAARDKAVADSAAARSKMQDLSRDIQDKIRLADKARQDGDRAAYEKAKSDLESTQKEYDALMEGPGNPVKAVNDAEYNVRRDTSIRMKARVNSGSENISGPLQDLHVAGSAAAFRRDYEDRERLSKALVLFGNWKIEKYGEGQSQSISATRTATKADKISAAYTASVEIEADKERLAGLVGALQSPALTGLLTQPPLE